MIDFFQFSFLHTNHLEWITQIQVLFELHPTLLWWQVQASNKSSFDRPVCLSAVYFLIFSTSWTNSFIYFGLFATDFIFFLLFAADLADASLFLFLTIFIFCKFSLWDFCLWIYYTLSSKLRLFLLFLDIISL